MSIDADIAFLSRVDPLSVLGQDALRILAIGAEMKVLHHGDVLFSQGQEVDAAFVVRTGRFVLTGGKEEPFAVAGDLLCELGLLLPWVPLVSAQAEGVSTVLRLSRSLFQRMLEGCPSAALRLRDDLAQRLDHTTGELNRVRNKLLAIQA